MPPAHRSGRGPRTKKSALERSACATLSTALTHVPGPVIGVYQVVFAPVSPEHDWHHNINSLIDLDYGIERAHAISHLTHDPDGAFPGLVKPIVGKVESMANRPKQFYVAVLRIGILSGKDDAETQLQLLTPIVDLIQHGGRPLRYLTDRDYHRLVSGAVIREMFLSGVTHRPGFLVNSSELTNLVHVR